MEVNELKFRIIYQSPNTDIPNELLISEGIYLDGLVSGRAQIDFKGGGYLMQNEMEAKYTTYEQYIGLKDINGKEAYVNDIYKTGGLIDIITFGDQETDDGWYLGYSIYCRSGFVIIGNIHENPELLNSILKNKV